MTDFTKNLPRHTNRGTPIAHTTANNPSRMRAVMSGLPLGALAYLLLCAGIGTVLFYFAGNVPGLGDLPLWASAVAGLSFIGVLANTVASGSMGLLMNVVAVAALPAAMRIVTELPGFAGDEQGKFPISTEMFQGTISMWMQWGVAALVTLMAFGLLAGSGDTGTDEDLPDGAAD